MTEKQFVETYCHNCGTQRCEGIGTPWFDGCKYKWSLDGMEIEATAEINRLQQQNLDLVIKIGSLQKQISNNKVKHSEWILHDNGSGTCKNCKTLQDHIWDYDNSQHYCGKCGAKMDGERRQKNDFKE